MASELGSIIVMTLIGGGNISGVEVEQAYWDCEYAATQGRISLDEGAACVEIFEDLKKGRFGGDFERFLSWWRENKEREISARARSGLPRDD